MAGDVRREGNRVWIAGMESANWGGTSSQQNSVMGALTAAFAAMGDPIDYTRLMGLSGAAFRVQFCWCPSAPHALCGRDCLVPLLKRTGYSVEWIQITRNNEALPRAQQQAREAVVASINAGRPVLQSSEECGLITGYVDNGESFLVRPYSAQFTDTPIGYSPMKGWPWSVGMIGERKSIPSELDAVTDSLADAVAMADESSSGAYTTGLQALRRWSTELADDAAMDAMISANWWATSLGNGYTYGCYSDARCDAASYLRTVSSLFDAGIASHLATAASHYERIVQITRAAKGPLACCWSLMPWDLKQPAAWTPALRHTQADVLSECLAIETAAVNELRHALGTPTRNDALVAG